MEKFSRDNNNLTLRVMLKDAAVKMRLRVTGYYQGENISILSNKGLILTYKDYSTISQKIKTF